MDKTVSYYNLNSKDYIASTISADMSVQYKMFEGYLGNGSLILDLGFGSGRDMLYFLEKGYRVKGIDASKNFVDAALKLGLDVVQGDFEEMQFEEKFNAIWACSSLLHAKRLEKALAACGDALVAGGVLYASFKYGEFTGYRDGRYFVDLTKAKLVRVFHNTPFKIVETEISKDVRRGRGSESWLNLIAIKQ